MSTTFVVIWCIVGFLIMSIAIASEKTNGYKFNDMFMCVVTGWFFGPIIVVWFTCLILPKLLEHPFKVSGNFFRRWLT